MDPHKQLKLGEAKKSSFLFFSIDIVYTLCYTIIVTSQPVIAGRERSMEQEEMNKADLIAILVSILEVAKEHGETHTVQHIEKILQEIRK